MFGLETSTPESSKFYHFGNGNTQKHEYTYIHMWIFGIEDWTIINTRAFVFSRDLDHSATHYNALHHTATHCITHIATHCIPNIATHCNTQQHTATHCYTLQHTATHCNTLQHTATHCNTIQMQEAHCNTL